MAPVETAKNFVNTWDCDENNHLNVQSYIAEFAVAEQHFRARAGLGAAALGPRLTRHIRYHRELVAGDYVAIRSRACRHAPFGFAIVHEMIEGTTGDLAATAIDAYQPVGSLDLAGELCGAMPEAALPRGLDAQPERFDIGTDLLLAHGGLVTYRGMVRPAECDADGFQEDRYIVARISNSAGYAWDHAGITRQWLDAHHCGRVAVELKISYRKAPRAGDLIHNVSTVTGYSGTTFRLRHHLFDSRRDRLVAIADVVHLVMHLDTRRAVPLDEERKQVLARRLAEAEGLPEPGITGDSRNVPHPGSR